MKKLLPIFLLVLTIAAFNSSCKKDKDVNPDFIITGEANGDNISHQATDTTYYKHEILLFDEFKIKVNYNYSSIMGGQQTNIKINLLEPTNIEFATVDGLTLVKRFLPGDTISSSLTWQAYQNNVSATMLDYSHGPLQNSTLGDWPLLSEGYIGIRAFKNNRYYYGWVKLKVVGGWFTSGLQLLGWAIYHD